MNTIIIQDTFIVVKIKNYSSKDMVCDVIEHMYYGRAYMIWKNIYVWKNTYTWKNIWKNIYMGRTYISWQKHVYYCTCHGSNCDTVVYRGRGPPYVCVCVCVCVCVFCLSPSPSSSLSLSHTLSLMYIYICTCTCTARIFSLAPWRVLARWC